MGPPKREPPPNQPQPPPGGASTYPPPHNTAAGFVESSAQQVVNYEHMQQQQQYDYDHNQTAAQQQIVVDHHQFQQHQQPPPPATYPPPPPQYRVAGNPTYDHQQQPQQQMAPPPPPVVQFPPPSPTNMPQQQQQAASFPPNNGVASFPPQNGHNGYNQNGYNMNMNNGMPPASPQKRVAYQPQPSPVNGIPMSGHPAGTPVAGWNSGLFDCMNDPMNAIITAFFPCLTFGQVAEIVDGGHTSCGTSGMLYGLIAFFLGVPFIMSCTYRTKMRSMFGLAESPAPDWVTHFLCEWCALCQEYRELQHRGYDPSIGWLGNQALRQHQQQQLAMAPPTNQRMMH